MSQSPDEVPFTRERPFQNIYKFLNLGDIPRTPSRASSEPITGISDIAPKDLVMAELGAVLSAAAYVYDKKEPQHVQEFIHRSLPTLDIRKVDVFENLGTFMFTLIFPHPETNRLAAAIVFRGSANLENWKANALASFVTDDRTASKGLYSSYRALRRRVKSTVLTLVRGLDKDSGDSLEEALSGGLYIFGHSLGGAMATYAAEDISRIHHNRVKKHLRPNWMQVMTYGQPREFTTLAEHLNDYRKVRFVVEGDPVPSFPTSSDTFDTGMIDDGPIPEFSIKQPKYTHVGDAIYLHRNPTELGTFLASTKAADFAATDDPSFFTAGRILSLFQGHHILHYVRVLHAIASQHQVRSTLQDNTRELLMSTDSVTETALKELLPK